jgi:hypothetical protein
MSREDDNEDEDKDDDHKLPSKPSPKRKQANPTASRNDFNSCTVHQVSGYMVNGSPATQQAASAVLDSLSSCSKNTSQTLVQSAVDRGSVSEGMSQEVAKTLHQAEKLHARV